MATGGTGETWLVLSTPWNPGPRSDAFALAVAWLVIGIALLCILSAT